MVRQWRDFCFLFGCVLGLLVLGAGVYLVFEADEIINSKIKQSVQLLPGSKAISSWTHPSLPIYMKIYFFDVQNAENITQYGHKPIVKEIGPYTYREIKDKTNLTFEDDDRKVSYRGPKGYIFERSMSVGDENDTFTGVNVPMLTVSTKIQYSSWFINKALAVIFASTGTRLFRELTIGGFLWGYEDPAFALINRLKTNAFPGNKWGLWYGDSGNMTNDGEFVVYTGKDNIEYINQIVTWKGNSSVDYWNDKYCDMVNGTDGSMWHPGIGKEETLYVFASDLCRSLYFTYDKEVVVEGVTLHKFVPPLAVFAAVEENPDNQCYCLDTCMKAGVLNVSSCKQGAPIVLSQPHFFQGDPEYINAIIGLNPSQSKHQSHLNVEHRTGIAMDVAKRIQLNAHIKPLSAFSDTSNMKPTVFPLLWMNEAAAIDANTAQKFKDKIFAPIQMLKIIKMCCLAIGSFLFAVFLVSFLLFRCRKKEKHTLEIYQLGNTQSFSDIKSH